VSHGVPSVGGAVAPERVSAKKASPEDERQGQGCTGTADTADREGTTRVINLRGARLHYIVKGRVWAAERPLM
jgi:hypothetical protein